jgi:uncharacterized protein YggE
MKTRLLIAVPALLAVVALAGAVGPAPDPARAQTADPSTSSVTVNGVGTVTSVPDEASFTFGVETRAQTAQAAIAANAAQMEKVIVALRKAGARDIATQWVSVYPVASDSGAVDGYSAPNSVSVTIGVARAGALVDAAADAGANQISGPGLSSSDADRLYRQALAAAVADARGRAEALAKAAGLSLGEITSMVESGAQPMPLYRAADAAASAPTPIEPGQQETTASVSITFDLR